MPLFEFECEECGERYEELLRSSSATDEVSCPKCGSARAHRLQSGFSTSCSQGSGKAASSGAGSSCGSGGRFT